MDQKELGERIARARDLAGSTQETMGERIGLDRSAISRIEKGERKVSVNELLAIAEVLSRPLAFFVAPAVPAVVNRRTNAGDSHESNILLDEELRSFASDVKEMLDSRVLSGVSRADHSVQRYSTHEDTENSANNIREKAGLTAVEPIQRLGSFCELFGLVTYAAEMPDDGPDGACVEVGEEGNQLGVAVINGRAMSGRRRMTLAHELGHWLTGDAYDREAPDEAEHLMQSFAIHLLAPRAGVKRIWEEHADRTKRDRAIAVCSEFFLSWSAGLSQLRNLGLIAVTDFAALKEPRPKTGEFARLGLVDRRDEPAAPWLSPGYTASVLDAYADEKLTAERTVELLRGTIDYDQFPPVNDLTLQSLQGSFSGHTA